MFLDPIPYFTVISIPMQIVKSLSVSSHSHLYNRLFHPKQAFSTSFSSLAKSPNPALFDYLIKTFNFSETQALTVSTRITSSKSVENANSAFHFFKNLGFSDSQIHTAARRSPQIIFANVNRSLKPKIKLFQDLGLVGYDLGNFISKSSPILSASLKNKLVPCIEILKKHLLNHGNNKHLVKVVNRCFWVITQKNPESRMLSCIAYWESCGIVGSQLSNLLIRQPSLLLCPESVLRDLVSRTLSMGFTANSGMLIHGLCAVYSSSDKTIERKYGIFRSFGFSEYQYREIFRKAPYLLTSSEEKLKLRINYFLNTMKFERETLLFNPAILMQSMEERVIPRFKVLEILKSKKLFKKKPSFVSVLFLTEEVFFQKYILSFSDMAEELLLAYKGHSMDSSIQE